MLISHMAFEAGWVDELQTEAALSLFHILWNDSVIVCLIGIHTQDLSNPHCFLAAD